MLPNSFVLLRTPSLPSFISRVLPSRSCHAGEFDAKLYFSLNSDEGLFKEIMRA